jgi:hypothetical protein
MLKYQDYQRHPAHISTKENKIKILIRVVGSVCKPARDTEQVRWQWVNACMAPRQLRRGTEQACWQRSNVGYMKICEKI